MITIINYIKRKNWRLLVVPLLVFSLALMIVSGIVSAYYNAYYFDGLASDGTFQLFNPLRRISLGQTPGKDFFFFHGTGIPYLFYLPFTLLGSTLFASEFSRWIISILLFYVSLYSIIYALVGNHKYSLTGLVFIGVFAKRIFNIHALMIPGNSLISVRSAVVLIALSILYIFYDRLKHSKKLEILLGFLAAAVTFITTEHGMALILALTVFLLIHSYRYYKRVISLETLISFGIYYISLCLFFILFTLSVSGEYWFKIIEYNFVNVSQDQFWYFGVPPNDFIKGFKDIFSDIYLMGVLALFCLLVYGFLKLQKLKIIVGDLFIFCIVLLIYGLLSSFSYFGYSHAGYLMPLFRIELLLLYLILLKIPWSRLLKKTDIKRPFLFLKVLFIVGTVIYSWLNFTGILFIAQKYKLEQLADPGTYFSGLRLNTKWADTVAVYKATIDKKKLKNSYIWSAYAGVAEVMFDTLNPSGYDYIIHALGKDKREQYVKDFKRYNPRYVITIREGYFPYEAWLQQQHWDFYEELLKRYEIKGITYHHYIWELSDPKSPSEKIGAPAPLNVVHEKPKKSVKERSVINTAYVEYEINNPSQNIPLFGSMTRYLLYLDGSVNTYPISLPPYHTSIKIPFFTLENINPIDAAKRYSVKTYPDFIHAKVKIKSIRIGDSYGAR